MDQPYPAAGQHPLPPKPPRQPRLPWYLVGVLALVCLGLTMALGWRTNQVTALRTERETWAQAGGQQPTGPGQTAAPEAPTTGQAPPPAGGPRLTPQPTTGERAEQLLALARRDPADPLAKGRADAPLVMIEWADYRCPFCAKFSLETRPELQPYIDSGSLRIEFRDLVMFGDESMLAAKATRAAGEQGKYFEYADQIWRLHTGQGHPTVGDAEVMAAAQAIGLDVGRFATDLADPELEKAVQADVTQAQSFGLNASPFFLIGTTPVSGALPASSFVELLEAHGAKK